MLVNCIYRNITNNFVDSVTYDGNARNGYPQYMETMGTGVYDSKTYNYVSIGRYPNGVDTNNNFDDFDLLCSTPGYANVMSMTIDGSDCNTNPPMSISGIQSVLYGYCFQNNNFVVLL
jgi:hypothetical protein